MKKVLVLPGWMTFIRFYEDNHDLDICYGKLDEYPSNADYVIGVSLGAMVVLRDIKYIQGRIILVNPPLPKRSLFAWFLCWFRYITTEGPFLERQGFTVNPFKFFIELARCVKLLGTDFAQTLGSIPRDKLIVVRGKLDNFFCDDEAVEFLHSKGVNVIEYDGGHNLSLELEKTLDNLLN